MSEPSVDFDWDSVEPSKTHLARNKAFQILVEQEVQRRVAEERHTIAEQAIRKFLSLALSPHALRRSHGAKWLAIRVQLAAFMLRIPGYEHLGGASEIARKSEVDRASVSRTAHLVRDAIGLPKAITRGSTRPDALK
jgi:hypothetical protein